MKKPVHPVRAYRDKHQKTLRDVADDFGVKVNTVWRWENWERTPETKHLTKLSRLTGASIPALMGLQTEDAA